MQWRMLGRRGETATWTVVGDLAQSSWPAPDEAHEAREVALFGEPLRGRQRWSVRSSRPRHSFHLATNYRNSAEIYEHAAAYAERAGLAADLPTAVRRTGVPPEERSLGGADLRVAVDEAVRELLDHVAGTVGRGRAARPGGGGAAAGSPGPRTWSARPAARTHAWSP